MSQSVSRALLEQVKRALDRSSDVAVPASDIRQYAGQPRVRFNRDAIARLQASIEAGGQTTPGIIRENPANGTRYELIDGERRWRAIMNIPEFRRPLYRARLIVANDESVQYLVSGVANFNREPHTPLETSDAILRLHRTLQIPLHEVATLLGLSYAWACSLARLEKLHSEVRAMLDPDLPSRLRLPLTAAVEIAALDKGLQLAVAKRVMTRELPAGSVRQEVIIVGESAGKPVQTAMLHFATPPTSARIGGES